MNFKEKMHKKSGITLISLAVTIIILLILAGITISAITSDNGIIKNAGRAKEEKEIANEKEIIEKATIQAMGNNKYGNIEESELQKRLDKETGEGKTGVADIGEEFEVIFNESNRYYILDKDRNIGEAQEIIKDDNPGDFTIGKSGEELDGSEEKPYEISCIEDLVVLSNIISAVSKFYNVYVSGNIIGSGGGLVGKVWGNVEIINCYNLTTIQGSGGSVGGIINYDDIGGTTTIVNCYNLGKLTSTSLIDNSYNTVSGIIGWAYNTGTRNIINTCSLGSISKKVGTSQNFYSTSGGAKVNLENCYYLDNIVNEKMIVNENSIVFSRGDTSIIDKLNEYVNEHKYDYAVELYTWELNDDGLPTLKK